MGIIQRHFIRSPFISSKLFSLFDDSLTVLLDAFDSGVDKLNTNSELLGYLSRLHSFLEVQLGDLQLL